MSARPFAAFRDEGLLWLVNASVFHPRGYALAFHWADDADPETDEPIGWSIVGDGSEPWQYATTDPGAPPHRTVDALFARTRELMP